MLKQLKTKLCRGPSALALCAAAGLFVLASPQAIAEQGKESQQYGQTPSSRATAPQKPSSRRRGNRWNGNRSGGGSC